MLVQKIAAILALSLSPLPVMANFNLSIAEAISVSSEPMGTFVGELQERWQFPSDHLPIGITFGDVSIASWNVLDAEYIDWVIERNSQGLSRSLIADEHVYIGDSGLTVRDRHVVDLILQMLDHPTHPKRLLAMQECGKPFLGELTARLPDSYRVLAHEGNAVIVDLRSFVVIDAKAVKGIFKDSPERSVQDVALKLNDGRVLRVVNAHLPGDPLKPAPLEFARYLNNTYDSNVISLAMGDMNFNECEMSDALSRALNVPYALYSPYCTNISPFNFRSKVIDHFILLPGELAPQFSASSPEEIIVGLGSVVGLLAGD